MRWLFPSVNFESAKRLAEALSLPPKTAQILIQRGLGDAQAAARFLQPELSDFHDPFLMAGKGTPGGRMVRGWGRREENLIFMGERRGPTTPGGGGSPGRWSSSRG